MTRQYLNENELNNREILPDLVRAFALFGIAVVNVAYFAYPSDITYHDGGLNAGIDNAAYFSVNSLFLFKSYTLFSFMFGVGLAYQMRSANRVGAAFTGQYFRRLSGLLLLGVLHVTLGFLGDILIVYALLGAALFLFRNSSVKILVRIGIALIILQVCVALLFSSGLYLSENQNPAQMDQFRAEMERARSIAVSHYKGSDFIAAAQQRWRDWAGMIIFAAPLQAPGALAFFMFGLAADRKGLLLDSSAPFWNRCRKIMLPIGLALSAVGSLIYLYSGNPMSSSALIGFAILLLGAPLSSLGYIGLIAKWASRPMTSAKTFVARGGTATLTAYLLQSLILSMIFCGYGLGLFQKVSAAGCVAIAMIVGLFSIVFASVWRLKFRRGPMETVLRKWTYG